MNINALKLNKFNLVFTEELYNLFDDIVNVDFPGLSLSTIQTGYNGLSSKSPGDDLTFTDLTITIVVDEFMENYDKFVEWMFLCKNPITGNTNEKMMPGTLIFYNEAKKAFKKTLFQDLYPIDVSPVSLATNIDETTYYQATITFSYTYYKNEYLYKQWKK